MTIEPTTPEQSYTIIGTGPYPIAWPYVAGGVLASVLLAGVRTDLVAGTDFFLSPAASETLGDLTLSAGAAALYSGGTLYMTRSTTPQQGWLATLGVREKGLEAQLDLMVMKLQELGLAVSRALRLDRVMKPFVPVANRVVIIGADLQPALGPTVDDILDAADNATDAAASAVAAAASAAAAQAAENSLVKNRRAWVTATAYQPSDIVQVNGSSYICIQAHTSGATFVADQGLGRWDDFALKGAAGTGTGDMLAANVGSEYVPNVAALRANLALPLSAYTPLAAQDLFTWTGGSGGLMNAGATLTNMPPGGAAGDRFIYKSQDDQNKFFCWFFKDGRIAVNHKNADVWSGWIFIPTMAELAAAIDNTKQVLHVRDERTSGTHGGNSTTSYQARVLNLIRTNTISGASLAANMITLPAGTYEIDATAPGYGCGRHRARLWDVTAGATLILGTVERTVATGELTISQSRIQGRFTLAAPSQVAIQHAASILFVNQGWGLAAGFIDNEVYTDVFIRKIS